MGGCAPSKMPNGEQQPPPPTVRKSSKFGFSSPGNSSGGKVPASLNASQHQVKKLADDDTYEVVQGGRSTFVPATLETPNNTPTPYRNNGNDVGLLEMMRDAGSQTLNTPPDNSQVPRPMLQFGAGTPKFSPRSVAPLATTETVSELGTPTPMEENKGFIRPGAYDAGHSLMPQPGKPRLLPPHSSMPLPHRFAFAPNAAQSFPSPSPISPSPITLSQGPPIVGQKAKPAVRPTAISPRNPPTNLTSFSPRTADTTDNVMITTTFSGGFAMRAPSNASSNSSGLPKPLSSSANSMKSVGKSNSSAENVSRATSGSPAGQTTTPGKAITEEFRIPNGLPNPQRMPEPASASDALDAFIEAATPRKPSRPKPGSGGLRAPQTAGNSPRGPLAGLHSSASGAKPVPTLPVYQPAKPLRKSPQSQSGTSAVAVQEPLSLPVDISRGNQISYRSQLAKKQTRIATLNTATGIDKFSSLDLDTGSDAHDRSDEDGVFAEREGLAEMPKSYRVSETVLEEMMLSLRDVKSLAGELLQLHDNNSKTLMNGHGDAIKEAYSCENGKVGGLETLLVAPDQKLLKDPLRAGKLILDLQLAVRMLLRDGNSHHAKQDDVFD